MTEAAVSKLETSISSIRLHQVSRIHSVYFYNMQVIQIALPRCNGNGMTIGSPNDTFVDIELHLQTARHKFAHREQIGMQLRYMKAFIDADLINLASHHHLHHNGSNTDCLEDAIISQMYTS
jgi:hypothetical protein